VGGTIGIWKITYSNDLWPQIDLNQPFLPCMTAHSDVEDSAVFMKWGSSIALSLGLLAAMW